MTKSNFVENVIKFILSRSDDQLGQLTVKKITTTLKISRSHIYHLFQDEMNMTPGEYLNKIKIIRSAILLENKCRLSIKKIAGKLGFSSPDYFNRVFKKHFGTTPGRYREYIHL
ncbi:MAG TPA: helix-turn-helix transcriptional regulator [Candidatus Kapabacteria bacterium]|nr:helix-turn-helix transcriptional regulator [Candidatus Kapabacteria bacterium]